MSDDKEITATYLPDRITSYKADIENLLTLHRFEEAEKLMSEVMEQGERLISVRPFTKEVYAVEKCCDLIYEYLRCEQRLEEGVACVKKMIAIVEEALSKETDELVFICHWGNCYKVAMDLRALGKEEETRVYCEKMLHYAKLGAEKYVNRRIFVKVCNGYLELGKSLENLGLCTEAGELYAEGKVYAKRLCEIESDEATRDILQEFYRRINRLKN